MHILPSYLSRARYGVTPTSWSWTTASLHFLCQQTQLCNSFLLILFRIKSKILLKVYKAFYDLTLHAHISDCNSYYYSLLSPLQSQWPPCSLNTPCMLTPQDLCTSLPHTQNALPPGIQIVYSLTSIRSLLKCHLTRNDSLILTHLPT